jgi:Predicted transcription factor, homolog of eukaryotic MBF1
MPDISKQLRNLRLELRLNQAELAEIVGVYKNTISRIERGIVFPDETTLQKFADNGINLDLKSNQNNEETEMTTGIAKEIIKVRKDLGLNQTQFAKKIGIDPSDMSRIELGKKEPSPLTLRKIKDKLGVDFSTNISTNQEVEMKEGKVRLIFNIENETFDLYYFSHREESTLKKTSYTNTYNLVITTEIDKLLKFLATKYPDQAKNTQIQNIKEVCLSITSTKTEYLYLLTIKGGMVGIVKFKPSKFEDIFEETKEPVIKEVYDKPLIPIPKLLQPELPKIDSTLERDVVILYKKLNQIRDQYDYTLEQISRLVVDKVTRKKPEVKGSICKVYKQEINEGNYIEVGTLNEKDEVVFKLPNKSEENFQNNWNIYYSSVFIKQTTWIYEDGTEELGTGYEFVPTNKIQEVESTDRKGVIGYVEHKAGIVQVIYYDRFVE